MPSGLQSSAVVVIAAAAIAVVAIASVEVVLAKRTWVQLVPARAPELSAALAWLVVAAADTAAAALGVVDVQVQVRIYVPSWQ